MNSDFDQCAVIRGLRDGDRAAWTTLYDRYSVDVWRYVARLVGSDAAAVADVVQEVFMAAARGARAFDSERGTLWSWLAGIAHHQAAAWWRQRSRLARLQARLESERSDLERFLSPDCEANDLLERRELIDLVRFVLADMPPDYAMLLTAKYLAESSLEEIATEADTTAEAVKSKLARARREFRARFERCAREVTLRASPGERAALP